MKKLKTGGRSAGTPNKATAEVREKFSLLLENNFDKMQKDIDLLEPKDRLNVLIQISKFVLPTLQSIDLDNTNEQNNFTPIIVNLGSPIKSNEQ